MGEVAEEKKGFVRVLCRDGTTQLEWPAEMVRQTQTAQPALSFSVNPLFFNFSHLVSAGVGGGADGAEEAAIKDKLEDYEVKISAEDGGAADADLGGGAEEAAPSKSRSGGKGGKERSGK